MFLGAAEGGERRPVMAPRRIVLVMIEPPLPFGNAAARWFYVLLKGLVERGHAVTAFAACSRPQEIEASLALFPAPAYDLRLYPFPKGGGVRGKWRTLRQPYSYMFGPELKRDLEAELARGFDVLHLEQLWSAWLGMGHVDRALVSVHYLAEIDLGESPSKGWRGALERRLMFGAERALLRRLRHVSTLSTRLEGEIRKINPSADVAVVPLGIDASLYPFIPDERRRDCVTIGLIGNMSWYPSYSAAKRLLGRLWPEIKRRVPDANVQIVGWSARSALRAHLEDPGVEIFEDVPETRPYFEKTGVMLYAPCRGSGMKIKILEAMGFGVPVVTTSEGVEGLPAVDGVHAGISEDDAGLIERAVALLQDPGLQERRRRAARTLLEEHCGPGPTVDAVESIYARMCVTR